MIVSACVVGIPCGKPGYVFSVPFCTSLTARGPEGVVGDDLVGVAVHGEDWDADLLQVVGVVLADEL